MKEFRSIRNGKKYQDIFKFKVTHSESCLVKSISKIMNVLDKNGKLNTSQIKIKSKLSWNSVINSLKILRKKRIIKLKTIQDKKNNEKIYSLDRNRAVCYHEHLSRWKNRDYFEDLNRKMHNPIKADIKIEKTLPSDWWNTELTFNNENQKRFLVKEKSIIEDLSIHKARRLRDEYLGGDLCYDCFENGNYSKVKSILKDDIVYCMTCGKERESVNLSVLNNEEIVSQESRRRYETMKQEEKILKRKRDSEFNIYDNV